MSFVPTEAPTIITWWPSWLIDYIDLSMRSRDQVTSNGDGHSFDKVALDMVL